MISTASPIGVLAPLTNLQLVRQARPLRAATPTSNLPRLFRARVMAHCYLYLLFRPRAGTQRGDRRNRAWLTTLKWLIGYGYYPYYAMGWAIGLVIVGALVLRVSGEGPPDIVSYSFDMLLPIIKLRESHFQIDLKTWARYFFTSTRSWATCLPPS